MLAQSALAGARASGLWSGPVASAAYAVLPPFHLVGLSRPLAQGSELAYAALYGVGLLLAALAVLRWRALGAGARE